MLSSRQVHLDFHTSELIPNIGKDFDPIKFSETIKESNINSVTVFARCHHGCLYYPSKKFPERVHPNLKYPNLLLDQVRALHSFGIKAPVYITVQWDYLSACTKPEWLIRKSDGSHEGDAFFKPGFYQSLCINTGYGDFLEEHTREVCELLGDDLDGLFFDIVGIRPCLCSACRKEMLEKGIDLSDEKAVRAFAFMSINRFKVKMTDLVRSYNKKCTIFYNAGHIGPCTRNTINDYTHFELESLPSGSWGYLHFPVTAKYARTFGIECLGMTGKFHTSWGDFHSTKNLAALEFECFRALSYGFAVSVGDQLEPTGKLNNATYDLIGKVFKQYREREEWARPSKALTEAAVVTTENYLYEHQIPDSILGAVQMLDELALQFDIIDCEHDFSNYKLIILPEDLIITEEYAQRIDNYIKNGGAVIAVANGGLTNHNQYPSKFGVTYVEKNQLYPDFIIAEGNLTQGLYDDNEYAIYMQGEKVISNGATPYLYARAPYFARSGREFCSHFYTPSAKSEKYPTAFKKENVILFSHPLFKQYRANAPIWCKILIKNAIKELLGTSLISHNGPSTLTVSLLDQPHKNRVCAHLLSYIPVRKSATIDIIEERTKVTNIELKLHLPQNIKSAVLIPQNIKLDISENTIVVPEVDGYQIVELNYEL